MGTGSGVKTITIGGGTDDTVSINGNLTVAGTTVTVNSTNTNILDKIITLNKGGAAASGALVGLEIEEGGSAAGGYLRTNATRDAWVAKAPNGSEVTIGGTSSQFQTNSGSNIYLPAGSNLAIGKSNAAYAVDVVGDVNISGNFRSNGALLSQFPLTLNQDPNLGLVPLSSITSNIAASTAGITYSAASLASNAIVTTDSSTSYVTMPNTVSTLSASTGITFSALVNFSAIDGYGSFILLSGGAGHSWEFGSHPSGSIRIYEVKADGDNYGLTSSTTLLTLNQTALFTACMAADGTVTMYKNGVAVTLGTRNGSSASRLPESYTYTCIYTNFVKGSTYFAAIYNTVLTPAQVLAQYNTLTAIAPTYIYNIYNSLSVPSNTYLGVGKTPAYALDVLGEINASSNIRIAGQSLQGLGVETQVVLTSGTGTWTVPTGVTNIKIIGTAAGGGGGGTSANGFDAGGGGGAGATQIWCGSVTPGQALTYTVGAGGAGGTAAAGSTGGNTTVTYSTQTYILANGGGGGQKPGSYSTTGGIGGTCGTALAQINVPGGDGQTTNLVGNYRPGTNGGPSYWGGGGTGGNGDYFNAGKNAVTYGAGGGGGRAGDVGGSGGAGVVIITYFTQSGLPTNYTASAPLSMSGTTLSLGVGTGLSVAGGTLNVALTPSVSMNRVYYYFLHKTTETGTNAELLPGSSYWTCKSSNSNYLPTYSSNRLVIPVTGVYSITLTLLYTNGGGAQSVDMYINGASPTSGDVYRAASDAGSPNINVRGSFIVSLTQGQTISWYAGTNGGQLYGDPNYHHSTFQMIQIS